MLYTERNVLSALEEGKLFLSPSDRMTPAARDLLREKGGTLTNKKPEHMTHLNRKEMVPKTHPRIAFRGKIDSLEAEILLSMKEPGAPLEALREILAFTRTLIRADVLEEPVAEPLLCGMNAQALRERSHNPQKYYGTNHILPQDSDSTVLLRLNYLRTQVRETELLSYHAFPKRTDLHRALNRLSSLFWILCLEERCKTNKGGPAWTGS